MDEDRDLSRLLFRGLDSFPDLQRFGDGEIGRFHQATTTMLTELAGDRDGTVDWAAITVVLHGATAHFWLLTDLFGRHPTGIDEDRFVAAAAALTAALSAQHPASRGGCRRGHRATTRSTREDTMRALLAGASGAIGLPLIRHLQASGHEVVAIHRSPHSRDRLLAAGVTPIQVDVLDRAALLAALDGHRCEAVITQLTALKKAPAMHKDMAATNRLRMDGTANLLDVAERVGAGRFVSQSMVFGYGYGDFGGRVLTEADRFAPPGHGRFEEHLAAMRSNEQQVLGAPHIEGIALRYGLFYGPGAASEALIDGVRRRRLPVVRHGGVLPWVHVDDAATATVAALERGTSGSAYNVADDEPVSFSELITAMAAALDAPRPHVVPSWLLTAAPYAKAIMTGGLRVGTAKAHAELGWAPQVPSYRDGVAELAQHDRRVAACPPVRRKSCSRPSRSSRS